MMSQNLGFPTFWVLGSSTQVPPAFNNSCSCRQGNILIVCMARHVDLDKI
jgi:hypothetical protein